MFLVILELVLAHLAVVRMETMTMTAVDLHVVATVLVVMLTVTEAHLDVDTTKTVADTTDPLQELVDPLMSILHHAEVMRMDTALVITLPDLIHT